MLNGWLTNNDIENIHNEAKNMLPSDNSEIIDKASDYIELVFKKWQIEHGVKPNRSLGVWVYSDNIDVSLTEEDIKKYKPWECAGWGVANKIDLALKLWVDDYKAFQDAEKKLSIFNIIAIALLDTKEPRHSNSIFRAYDLIQQHIIWKLRRQISEFSDKDKKRDDQLEEARLIRAIKIKERSKQYHTDWEQWANETLKENPYWSLDQISAHVHAISIRQGQKMTNGKQYSFSTIRKSIAGFKKRAGA